LRVIVLTAVLNSLQRHTRSLPNRLMHPHAADPGIAAVVDDPLRDLGSRDNNHTIDGSDRRKSASDAAEELVEGEMPPAIYRLMHAHARLSDVDRDRLVRGLAKTLGVSHREAGHRER
jgi:hypothetical protein